MIHKPPQAKKDDERQRAFSDAMRSIAHMPDPAEAHKWLSSNCLVGLATAYYSGGAWRLSATAMDLAKELRSYGLVEARGPYLTAFGYAVRRVLKEQEG